jgi:putative transposase
MCAFIDSERERFGVEPICKVLQFAPSTYYAALARRAAPSARELRDRELIVEIRRVHKAHLSVYGARKVWLQLRREGFDVARCTVERLMAQIGLEGARRGGKKRFTTTADAAAPRAEDKLERNFTAAGPNVVWVTDFTYVATWEGVAYVSFVVDVFSRRIVGWRVMRSMKTDLVLDTIEMAIWSRDHDGVPTSAGLICHSDAGSQYTSFAFTQRLIEAGIDPSIGSVGDAYDNALAETTIGLFKTEMIGPGAPWKTVADVELATLTWVDWYNNRRLHSACGDIPPVEFEANHAVALVTQ